MSNPEPVFTDPQDAPHTGAPEMIPLHSAYLAAAGYDPNRDELLITFLDSGTTIAYQGVGHNALRAILTAPSPGRWLHANLHGLPYRTVS